MSGDASTDLILTNKCTRQLSPLECNGGSMAITITCIRHSHSALKIPSWEAIIINTEYMDHSHELFSSLFTIICHLSCHRSARNLCLPPITRQQTQNRRRVKCSPTWSLALSYRQDFTVSYFTDMFWRNILLQQQLNTQGLADHLEWNIYRGPHLCVMFNPIPKMRNCKYSKYTKISNAIKYKRSLYTTYLHGMGVARRERLVRYLFNVLLFIQNLFRIVNANATKRTRRKYL